MHPARELDRHVAGVEHDGLRRAEARHLDLPEVGVVRRRDRPRDLQLRGAAERVQTETLAGVSLRDAYCPELRHAARRPACPTREGDEAREHYSRFCWAPT